VRFVTPPAMCSALLVMNDDNAYVLHRFLYVEELLREPSEVLHLVAGDFGADAAGRLRRGVRRRGRPFGLVRWSS
jgi:hypothetical protein